MSTLDESASTIVELLTRLDTRLEALEGKMDALLAGARKAEPAVAQAGATTLYDRRRSQAAFDGADRRMGEI